MNTENIENIEHKEIPTGEKPPQVIITHGDTNSISYEVIIKALSDPRIFDFINPVIYGNSKLASFHKKTVDAPNFTFNLVRNLESAHPKRANIINIVEDEVKVELGKETPISGEMAYLSLEKAISDMQKHKAQILVTAPVSKKAIQTIYHDFKGHTEYLAEKFNSADNLMIMCGSLMKIALATTHVALSDVSKTITKELLYKKLYLFYHTLIQDFNIDRPKVAVLGLNPHAGDQGMFGNEEKEVIYPVIESLNQEGMDIFGPFPSDGYFGNLKFKDFDGTFAMYHDQALIPFKTLCFEDGVNFTAGLPIVRTSPAHGTAYDIAGMDKASGKPFAAALLMAAEIYNNRKRYLENRKNPL